MPSKLKVSTIRFPCDVEDELSEYIKAKGATKNKVVVLAVRKHLEQEKEKAG